MNKPMLGYDGSTPILHPDGIHPVVMESPIPAGKTHFSLENAAVFPPGNPTYSWAGGVLTVTHTSQVWAGWAAQFIASMYLVYEGHTTINISFSTTRNMPDYYPNLSVSITAPSSEEELSMVGPGNHTLPFIYYRQKLYINLWCEPAYDEFDNYIPETVTVSFTFS